MRSDRDDRRQIQFVFGMEQAVIESSNAGVPVDHPAWPPGRLGDPDYGSR
jgi:hypothetical protein